MSQYQAFVNMAIKLYRQGKSIEAVADKLHSTPSVIYIILVNEGVIKEIKPNHDSE